MRRSFRRIAVVAERYAAFVRCAGCERIFWQGSHWERMCEMLGASLAIRIPAGAPAP